MGVNKLHFEENSYNRCSCEWICHFCLNWFSKKCPKSFFNFTWAGHCANWFILIRYVKDFNYAHFFFSIGQSQTNFSNLDIFVDWKLWYVYIEVRNMLIQKVKTKNKSKNRFSRFWPLNVQSWSTLAGFFSQPSGQNLFKLVLY